MENENFLEKFAAKFSQNASVKNVFGEPIQLGEKIIIPVAQIAFGLGGGYGQGRKKKNKNVVNEDSTENALPVENGLNSQGAGGGGGMYAKAKGVYEITPTSTRFIPTYNLSQIIVSVATGFLISKLFFRKRKRQEK